MLQMNVLAKLLLFDMLLFYQQVQALHRYCMTHMSHYLRVNELHIVVGMLPQLFVFFLKEINS